MSDESCDATRRAPGPVSRVAARATALFLVLALAACAQAPRETFDLSGTSGAGRVIAARGGAALSVSEPTAVAPTSSDRVVVRDADGSVAVLPGVQWSEGLPRLFRDRLIEALQRAGVSAARINVAANRSLATDVRRFEIDVARDRAVVEIAVRIVDDASGSTRAAKAFTAEWPAPTHTGAPAVHALGDAAAEAAARIAAWTRAQL